VAIGDRYLSYGAALGVTGCAGDVLDLEMGDRRKVWSSCRGGWRRIKVRYPAAWPWSASTTRALVLRAALFIATAAVVLAATGPTGWISLPGYALLAGGIYMLVRAVLDAGRPGGPSRRDGHGHLRAGTPGAAGPASGVHRGRGPARRPVGTRPAEPARRRMTSSCSAPSGRMELPGGWPGSSTGAVRTKKTVRT
jgi:hypothetical protein